MNIKSVDKIIKPFCENMKIFYCLLFYKEKQYNISKIGSF